MSRHFLQARRGIGYKRREVKQIRAVNGMIKFGMGQAVRRKEDERFLTGHGRYTDDITLDGQLHAHMVRSPFAAARILSIDTEAAAAAPGVVAVVTGADLAADDIPPLPPLFTVKSADGTPMPVPERPALATEAVHHVGEAVAMVIAESPQAAEDAAELVEVEYDDEFEAVVEADAALEPDAPRVHAGLDSNRAFDWRHGDHDAVEAAMAKAAHIAEIDLINNRVSANPMEPRAAIGDFDTATGRMTLYTGSQGAHNLRNLIAERIFNIPREQLRVVTPDVGGGFGMKIFLYPEHVLVLWAARKLKRPVKWTAQRGESLMNDTHGRDLKSHARLALDAEGRILAFDVQTIANLGAYVSHFGAFIPTMAAAGLSTTVYRIPAAALTVQGVFTNTAPVDAYRGAGRPEANYLMERLIDNAARDMGLDPAELRRRNFVAKEEMPYTNFFGTTYDSGNFTETMQRALKRADYDTVDQRREQARARGRLLGIGIGSYIEWTVGNPKEFAEIRFDDDGGLTVLMGTQSNGQGHETTYAQVVAERLGIDFAKIRVVQGDTDQIASGSGTGGSRSLYMGGGALVEASDRIIAKARAIAAQELEAAEVDIEFAEGRFTIVGTDRSITIEEVARIAKDPSRLPAGMEPGLDESATYQRTAPTFPNGCHVAEVEIEPETGCVEITRYTVVDDFGRVVNPMVVFGQVQGGVVQGIGQALMEDVVYEEGSGQLLTGTFMDYAMPRADNAPVIDFSLNEDEPNTTNPLGVKGCGEAGTIGALPAVMNAITDALIRAAPGPLTCPPRPRRSGAP